MALELRCYGTGIWRPIQIQPKRVGRAYRRRRGGDDSFDCSARLSVVFSQQRGVVIAGGLALWHRLRPIKEAEVHNKRPLGIVASLSSLSHHSYENANSLARWTAFTTALIKVTRNFPSSSSMMPSMVHPAGVVTASFSSAG